MSPAPDRPTEHAGLQPTAEQLMRALLGLQDRMADVESALRDQVEAAPQVLRDGVASGIRAAVSDPELWKAVIAAVQAHAKAEAGGWLFGGVAAAMSKLAWVLVIGLAVYLLGGWSALVTLIKATGAGQS